MKSWTDVPGNNQKESKGVTMDYRVDNETLLQWLEEGKEKGASHCLIVCDTWDYAEGFEDFPVYVMPDENVDVIKKKYPRGGIEVFVAQFDLTHNLKEQAGRYDRNTGFKYGDRLFDI